MGKRNRRLTTLGVLVVTAGLGTGTAWAQPTLVVGSVSGGPGQTVTFSVTLNSAGTSVTGTQNDIDFTADTPIAVTSAGSCAVTTTQTCNTEADCPALPAPFEGSEPCVNLNGPNCAVNPAIGKGGFFSFLPNEPGNPCSGSTCTGIRALIFALDNTDVIADGSVLYTCKVNIAPGATAGDYSLAVSGVNMADTEFNLVEGASGTDGTVTVSPAAAQVLVCDAAPSTGDDAGQFGNGTVNNSDVVAIFRASLLGPPPAESARFVAMDPIPADSPPTCGGNGSVVNSDVVACFRRSLLPNEPNYTRSLSNGTCESTQVQP